MEQEQDGLVVRYEYRDTDGTGKLDVLVRSGGFEGASSASSATTNCWSSPASY